MCGMHIVCYIFVVMYVNDGHLSTFEIFEFLLITSMSAALSILNVSDIQINDLL